MSRQISSSNTYPTAYTQSYLLPKTKDIEAVKSRRFYATNASRAPIRNSRYSNGDKISPSIQQSTRSTSLDLQDPAATKTAEVTASQIEAKKEYDISSTSQLEWYEKLRDMERQQKEGRVLSLRKENGETIVLANIPDDVRTYTWRSAEWSWGVTERLFQDCEQAKLTFEKEEFIDDKDGKKKVRVKAGEGGLHIGHGKGWWFDSEFGTSL